MAENLNLKTVDTVDTRPFKKLVMTIGELPTSFIESMTYYELLAWFTNYLETVIIPTVNNNAEATKELQELFTELKNFVDNYFDNLDVQEEINNKLDEMAESGQLADIIAQYLTLAGVLAFDTVNDLSNATNVAIGSTCKTLGYKRFNDGVYDYYRIREVDNDDVIDGYNIVTITSTDNLVAERLQYGKKVVIRLSTTDNIQDYLDLTCDKTIILPYKTTVDTSSSLFINSDTTIDLNKSTLNYTGQSEVIALAYRGDDTFTKYDGYSNIVIKNGTIKGGCLLFMHNQNVLIEGVNFDEVNNSRHNMQIASCNNLTVRGCTFNGTKIDAETASECINIDPCNYGSQPWLASDSPMLDHYHNSNIVVENNLFNNSTDTSNYRYTNAVGSHGRDTGYPLICDGIIIRNNDFGSPYYSAINICDYNNAVIENNNAAFDLTNSASAVFFIRQVYGVKDIHIINNNVKNCVSFFRNESQDAIKDGIIIESNIVESKDTAANATIDLVASSNVTISNNVFDVEGSFYRSTWRNGASNTCKYIKLISNIINKHNAGLATVLRIYNTESSVFLNNTLHYVNVTPSSGYYFFTTDGVIDNNSYSNNKTEYPFYFAASNKITDDFSFNNGEYPLTPGFGSVTSGSGTLTIPINRLSVLRLQIGSSSNMYFKELYPFLGDGRKFTDGNKTWRVPIIKGDGTLGNVTLSISNNGTEFSWTGDSPLRQIYGRD